MQTIASVVDSVHSAVTDCDDPMDLGPADVGYIISLFLEAVIHSNAGPPLHPAVAEFLQTLADGANAVQNEE